MKLLDMILGYQEAGLGKPLALLTLPEALLVSLGELTQEALDQYTGSKPEGYRPYITGSEVVENLPREYCGADLDAKNISSSFTQMWKQGRVDRRGEPGAYSYKMTDKGVMDMKKATEHLDILIGEDEIGTPVEVPEPEAKVETPMKGELTDAERLDKLESFVLKLGTNVQELTNAVNELKKAPAPAKAKAKVKGKNGVEMAEYVYNGTPFTAPAHEELVKLAAEYVNKFGEGVKRHGQFAWWLKSKGYITEDDRPTAKKWLNANLAQLKLAKNEDSKLVKA